MRFTEQDISAIALVLGFTVAYDDEGQVIVHTGIYNQEKLFYHYNQGRLDAEPNESSSGKSVMREIREYAQDEVERAMLEAEFESVEREALALVDDIDDLEPAVSQRETIPGRNAYGGFGCITEFSTGLPIDSD